MEDVRKHLDIRTRILAIYSRTEQDFDSKGAWDDYQETVEDIIYKLEFNIDVADVEEQIRDHQRFQAGRHAAAADAPTSAGYTPAAADGPVLPVLRTPATVDAEGRLMPVRPPLAGREQLLAAAAAGGWDPGIAVRRSLQDTFTTIFLC